MSSSQLLDKTKDEDTAKQVIKDGKPQPQPATKSVKADATPKVAPKADGKPETKGSLRVFTL